MILSSQVHSRGVASLGQCATEFQISISSLADGQSEVTNKITVMYLRCLTCDHPRHGYNCYLGLNIATILDFRFHWVPFMVYGWDPPSLRSYELGSACLHAVDHMLADRDEFLVEIRDHLE